MSDPTLTGFECRVAGVHDWLSCSSGRQENPTASGGYTFQVRAVDASGNRSSESAWGWTVDKTAPETSLEPGVGPAEGSTTSSRSAEFQFNSNESGDFVCTLNGAPVTCGSPKQYDSLPDHAYTFSVAARDTAGNVDATPLTRHWTVDGTPPVPSIDSGPADGSSAEGSSATFGFSANETASFLCRVYPAASAAPAYGACSGPSSHSATGLAPGTYRFDVKATDTASNQASTGRTFTLTAPATGGDPGAGGDPGGGSPGGATPGGGDPGGGTPPDLVGPLMSLPTRALRLAKGAVGVTVGCAASEAGGCIGKVTITSARKIAAASGTRKRKVTFGSASSSSRAVNPRLSR